MPSRPFRPYLPGAVSRRRLRALNAAQRSALVAEKTAEVLVGRPTTAKAFAMIGHPNLWPMWPRMPAALRAHLKGEWAHWRASPETFFTHLDPPPAGDAA